MHHKIIDTIRAHQMLEVGDRVVVGFSGGADSVSLLSFLWEERAVFQIDPLACHINHTLRGAESDRDEAFVRAFCQQRGIPLEVATIDAAGGAKAAGCSVELYAREERYRIFGEVANRFGAGVGRVKIATAHTLSDKIETVLFHLARGTGLRGLEGIPAVRGSIIRPLIDCTRQEVEAYCTAHDLSYVIDKSNLSDQYTRNRIRHHIVPELEAINPALSQSIRRMTGVVERDRIFLDQLAEEAGANLRSPEGKFPLEGWRKLNPALRDRIAAGLLKETGAAVSVKKIAELLILTEKGGALEVVKGKRVCCRNGMLWVETEKEKQPYFEFPLIIGENRLFEGKEVNILLCEYEKYKNIEKKHPDVLKKVLDYDRIDDIAVIRQKKDGDRILLYPQSNTRSLKKFLNEAKIPVEQRSRLAVVSDRLGPIWVEGFGCDKRVAPCAQTKKVLLLAVNWEGEKDNDRRYFESFGF